MTIKDVAKNSGVSVSTVSRVLNGRPDVSETVRQRVLDEVERSGYIPNNSARNLVRSSSNGIGVIVRGTGNLFFSRVLKTIADEIELFGFTPVPHFIASDADEVKAGAALERENKLQGLLFLGGRFDYTSAELTPISVPFVCCSYTNCYGTLSEESYSSVSIDDYMTARRATEELLRRGHRRIAALIPDRNDRSISELRYRGFRDALSEWGSFEMADAYEGVCRLLRLNLDFTALFMLSDTIALAGMKALESHGKRIPEDVSVIAIDGLNVSEYAIPPLTTMVQPAEKMGKESVRILMRMLEEPGYARQKLLEATLREGASVRSI